MTTFQAPMTAFQATTARQRVTDAMADEAIQRTALEIEPNCDERPFQAGEAVVYAAHGVGKIERVGVQQIAGHSVEIIEVSFPANRMTLRIPKAKARAAGLRRLATRERADEAIAILAGRPRISKGLWARRAVELQSRISSGQIRRIAEVVRDLRHHALSDKGSFSERQIFVAAFERLVSELAILTDASTEATTERLTAIIREAEKTAPPAIVDASEADLVAEAVADGQELA